MLQEVFGKINQALYTIGTVKKTAIKQKNLKELIC